MFRFVSLKLPEKEVISSSVDVPPLLNLSESIQDGFALRGVIVKVL